MNKTLQCSVVAGIVSLAGFSMAAQQLQQHPTPEQEQAMAAEEAAANATISLDVMVHSKNGGPGPAMEPGQLTVLVDKKPAKVTEFKAIHAGDEPERVVLVFDPNSLPGDDLKIVKGKINDFLTHDGGKLPIPTAVALVGRNGLKISGYTQDGNVLAKTFADGVPVDAHSGSPAVGGDDSDTGGGRGGHGGYGHGGSSQQSLNAIQRMIADSAAFHGRTAMVWMTQGWPLDFGPTLQLTDAQRLMLMREAEMFTNFMRRSRLTLYVLDPIEKDKFDQMTSQYVGFLKGPSYPRESAPAFLGIQILAIHSGGWVQVSSDITKVMSEVYGDLGQYYRVSFAAEPAAKPDTFHYIDVKTPSKETNARTNDMYWANPAGMSPAAAPTK